MKTIITFGSNHLEWLHHKLNPMKVALVIETDSEDKARSIVVNSRIGEYFCTSYPYEKNIAKFKAMGMLEYTLEELEANIIKEDKLVWEPCSYGVVMTSLRDFFIYHNEYDDNYTVQHQAAITPFLKNVTIERVIDFLNHSRKDSK